VLQLSITLNYLAKRGCNIFFRLAGELDTDFCLGGADQVVV